METGGDHIGKTGFRVMEGHGGMRVNQWVVYMSKIVKEHTNKGGVERCTPFKVTIATSFLYRNSQLSTVATEPTSTSWAACALYEDWTLSVFAYHHPPCVFQRLETDVTAVLHTAMALNYLKFMCPCHAYKNHLSQSPSMLRHPEGKGNIIKDSKF